MDLKHSSRARMTPHNLGSFAGETLYDAIGRAVCEASCLPRKEFFESWAVAKRVHRKVHGTPILELAGGHGLLSYILLLLNRESGPALCVDRRKPLSVARMEPSPEVLAALPVMVDGALREAGVSREDYEAYQRQVLADPARREQVAAAILERVDKQATPEMRVRAMSLVEGFYHSQRARESE